MRDDATTRLPSPKLHDQLQTPSKGLDMIRKFYRLRPAPLSRLQCRAFSVKAICSSFPASLAYYSPRHKSSLFDHKENDSRPNDLYDEGVVVARDGLVYPGVRPGEFLLFTLLDDTK